MLTEQRQTRETTRDEAERDLVLAARTQGQELDRLIEKFLPLIGSVARIYCHAPGIDRNELMQDGVVGLLRALKRYDPTLRTPFWAYASWWVRQAMQQLVSELSGPIVLSDRAARQLAQVKGAERKYMQKHGAEPSACELAEATGMCREHVESLLAANRRPRGIDDRGGRDRNSGTAIADMSADPLSDSAYERVPEHVAAEHLPEMLDELSGRERAVLRGRFGIDCREQTLRELATGLGVSAERVRQIEGAALGKLRANLAPD